jgi:hypothetical protein
MKEYKIFIPISIDGEKSVKELSVIANSVTEAHLAGVAWVKESIKLIEYPSKDEMKSHSYMSAGYKDEGLDSSCGE